MSIRDYYSKPWESQGKIECPGDSCPQECNNDCPIWLHTQAADLMNKKKYIEAIDLYNTAVQIEPSFYEAWNNLAGCYGTICNYQKAYDCYLKAHEINNQKISPIYGLAMVTRDLGEYEECIKWCEMYSGYSGDGRTDSILDDAKRHMEIFNRGKTETTNVVTQNKLENIKAEPVISNKLQSDDLKQPSIPKQGKLSAPKKEKFTIKLSHKPKESIEEPKYEALSFNEIKNVLKQAPDQNEQPGKKKNKKILLIAIAALCSVFFAVSVTLTVFHILDRNQISDLNEQITTLARLNSVNQKIKAI